MGGWSFGRSSDRPGLPLRRGTATHTPNTFTTTLGARVTWFNNDTTFHVVTGDNGNWIGSNMGTNSSFTTVFTQPGTYAYHCGFHPTMVGTIIVNP